MRWQFTSENKKWFWYLRTYGLVGWHLGIDFFCNFEDGVVFEFEICILKISLQFTLEYKSSGPLNQ